jgi:hypothetical protein
MKSMPKTMETTLAIMLNSPQPAAVAEAQAGLAAQAAVIVGTVKTKSSPLLLSILA